MRARLLPCPCCAGPGPAFRASAIDTPGAATGDDPGRGRRALLRGALGLGAGLAGAAAGGGAALAQATAGAPRRLLIQRMQTGDVFDDVYWRDGRYDRDALKRLDWLFRDPSRDEATPMDPRLFDVMHVVSREMDATEGFQVISGYRAPETNAARARESRRVSRASLHMSGMAADVRLPGRDSFGLARLAAEMQIGGVGLYRRDGFVHLDCGPARRW